VGTEKVVVALDDAGKQVFSAPLARFGDKYQVKQVGVLDNPQRYVVWYGPAWELAPQADHTLPSYVVELDPSGQEIARQTVPPRPVIPPSRALALFGLATPIAEIAGLLGTIQFAMFSRTDHSVPPLLLFAVNGTEHFLPGGVWTASLEGGPRSAFAALMLLSAVVCAGVCYRIARLWAFDRRACVGWALCGLLFGPAGLLLLFALHEWPTRVACPHCHKLRVVTRITCEHCGASHASPARDGTEIFEEPGAAPHAAPALH
jgi:hypothetical protein